MYKCKVIAIENQKGGTGKSSRKVMDITECVIDNFGERHYRTLFRYKITKNDLVDGKFIIEGEFEQPNIMSDELKAKLIQFGVPQDLLQRFLKAEYSAKGTTRKKTKKPAEKKTEDEPVEPISDPGEYLNSLRYSQFRGNAVSLGK